MAETSTPTAPGRPTLLVLVLAAALAATALPALLVPMPPLLDYPNHYVRLWLLGGGLAWPPLSRIYAVDWRGAGTNILIDLVAAATAGVLPVTVVGPVLLAAALALPGLGMTVLGRVVHGRFGSWHVLLAMLGWTSVLLLGFLNFQLSLGLALLAAAAEVRAGRQRWLPLWRAGCAAGLLVAHAFGLLFYAALVAGLAVGPAWPSGRRGWLAATGRTAAALAPVLVVPALFWLLAPHPADARSGPAEPTQWQGRWLVGSPAVLLSAVKAYRPPVDLLFAAILLLPVALALRGRRLAAHAGLLLACAGLAAGALLMPRYLAGTALLHLRLPVMLWFALGAALLPEPVAGRTARGLVTAAALAVVVARAGWFGTIWLRRQADVASVTRALAVVPIGARVLPMTQAPDEADYRRLPLGRAIGHNLLFWHLPTLAIMQRQAFVPTLFASPGKQVVRTRPPFSRIAVTEGAIATVDRLGRPLPPADRHQFGYVERWPCFDYVLVVDADVPNASGPLRRPAQLVPIADQGFAKLFRVTPEGARRCGIAALDRMDVATRQSARP